MFENIFTDTFFIGLVIVLINGIVTGFAVYIGSHTGQRMIEKIKNSDNKTSQISKEDKELIDAVTKARDLKDG
jgi:hypothetical protein